MTAWCCKISACTKIIFCHVVITVILTQFLLYYLITAESLIVQVLDSTILKSGDNLNLTCLVSAYDLAALDLEVTWLLNESHILTHLSRDGVVAKTSDIFSINQVGEGNFRLEIHSVELSDRGLYLCRVRAWIQQSRGKWYQAAEKTSAPVQVLITPQGELTQLCLYIFKSYSQAQTIQNLTTTVHRCPLTYKK